MHIRRGFREEKIHLREREGVKQFVQEVSRYSDIQKRFGFPQERLRRSKVGVSISRSAVWVTGRPRLVP